MKNLLSLLLIFFLTCTPCQAANLEAEYAFSESFSAIKDQTFTFTGHDFASFFIKKWAELGGVKTADTIVIQERPAGSRGSRIWIEFRFKQIYSGFFSPNRSRLKESAEAAAEQAVAVVGEIEVSKLLFKDPDLGPEEL